jgi:cytochrome P450 family 142 subfamily A polypeptide 1
MVVDIDVAYLDSKSWEEGPMRERMRWLREHEPVRWSEKDGLWLVSRFADVVEVSKNQEIYTSAEGVRPGMAVKIGLIDEGEPRHGQLRNLINRGFTPRMVKQLEVTFRRIVTEAIDSVANQGECDFVESISVPLPLRLIAAMIGIPDEDYDQFHTWSDAMIAAEGRQDDIEVMIRAGQAYAQYAAYVTEIIEDRKKNPRDDLVSILSGAKDAGLLKMYDEVGREETAPGISAELHNDELIKLLVILMVAGNETTRNGISGGMQLLMENPDARQRLIDDPSLIGIAVEEMVRLTSPVVSFSRTVTRDTVLRDKSLEAGQRVLMLYPSANRDENEFEDPERFVIERNPHHVGFGIGSHFCMGANLARMEMRVAFEEILRRIPDIEYAEGGPVLQPSALVRTCAEMKVRFTPEARNAA